MNEFKQDFKNKIEYVDDKLKGYMNSLKDIPDTLFKAMEYSVLAGGKRIRPILMMSSYELFKERDELIEDFAVAIELIHTYSLIHDDLPCMDNDDYRRGKLTNHKVFGENIAVLAGDALLNQSMELMLNRIASAEDKKAGVNAMKFIYESVGSKGMIAGQCADIESETMLEPNEKFLHYIQENKTAKLINASFVSGGILAGVSENDLELLYKYSNSIGLAFQIMDDILDVIGNEKQLGKSVGKDKDQNKLTYPKIYGLDKCREIAQENINFAKNSINKLNKDTKFLCDLADFIIDREI